MITEVEVSEWKVDPVTIRFMEGMAELEQEALLKLSVNVQDNVSDDWYKGYIAAVRDIQRADFEVEE